jgi:hypothetical protein
VQQPGPLAHAGNAITGPVPRAAAPVVDDLDPKLAVVLGKHGFPDMPDPTAQGALLIPSSIDMNSPHYKAAAKLCNAPPPPPGG